MLHAVFVDPFADHADARNSGQQGHEGRLKIRRESREWLGGDIHSLKVAWMNRDASLIHIQPATTVAQLLQNRVEVIGDHRFHP